VFTASFDRPNIRYLLAQQDGRQSQLLAFLGGLTAVRRGIVYARSRSRGGIASHELAGGRPRRCGLSRPGLERGKRARRRRSAFRREAGGGGGGHDFAFGRHRQNPMCAFVAPSNLPQESWRPTTQETGAPAATDAAVSLDGAWAGGTWPSCAASLGRDSGAEAADAWSTASSEALIGFTEAAGAARRCLLGPPRRNAGPVLVATAGPLPGNPQSGWTRTVPAQKTSRPCSAPASASAPPMWWMCCSVQHRPVRSMGHHSRLKCVRNRQGTRDQGRWRSLLAPAHGEGLLEPVPAWPWRPALGPEEVVRACLAA